MSQRAKAKNSDFPVRIFSAGGKGLASNPHNSAWLPLLHTERAPWHFTALYSNTARAHKLDRVRDWVVIYSYDGDHVEHQRTVVTEIRGLLAGSRVVRGREEECRAWYTRTQA